MSKKRFMPEQIISKLREAELNRLRVRLDEAEHAGNKLVWDAVDAEMRQLDEHRQHIKFGMNAEELEQDAQMQNKHRT